jgi:hypothetical protein
MFGVVMDGKYYRLLIFVKDVSFDKFYHSIKGDNIKLIIKLFPDAILHYHNPNLCVLSDKNFEIPFKNNDIETVDKLLSCCNYPQPEYLLLYAVAYSNENMINYLLNYQNYCTEKCNSQYYILRAVLMACTRIDNPGLLSILLNYHCDSDKIDIDYKNGLFMAQAIVSNNIPGIKILLAHGFYMESYGSKFLYLALRHKAYESFHYLVKDPDSFVDNLIEDYPRLISNFCEYIEEYGIELRPQSLQKLVQKN